MKINQYYEIRTNVFDGVRCSYLSNVIHGLKEPSSLTIALNELVKNSINSNSKDATNHVLYVLSFFYINDIISKDLYMYFTEKIKQAEKFYEGWWNLL